MNPRTPLQIRELVVAGRKMFRHSPLSDDELEAIARAALDRWKPYNCLRCGRPVTKARQVCRERTPASVFCWEEQLQPGEIEIQPGLRMRGPNYPALLQLPDDPYAD